MDVAYWCYTLLGCGYLFPWFALITAADYWEMRYPGRHMDRLLTAFYLPANLLAVAAMVASHGRLGARLRVVGGFLGFAAAITVVAMLGSVPSSPYTMHVCLTCVAICGLCDGAVSGALFGEAALLAPCFSQAVMAGTAVSGVTVSLLRMLTKATLPGTPAGVRQSAALYFGVAACVCLACATVHTCVLPRLAVVRRRRSTVLAAALLEYSHTHDEELAAGSALNARLPAMVAERAATPPPRGPDEIQLTPLGSPTRGHAWRRPETRLSLSPESLFAGKWSCASSATLADFAAAPPADGAWRPSTADHHWHPSQGACLSPQTLFQSHWSEASFAAHGADPRQPASPVAWQAPVGACPSPASMFYSHWATAAPPAQPWELPPGSQSPESLFESKWSVSSQAGGEPATPEHERPLLHRPMARRAGTPPPVVTLAHLSRVGLSAGGVFAIIWPLALSNMLLFTVTLSIFPGVLVEDEHSEVLGSWFPILLITSYNLGDWAGKTLPGWPPLRIDNAAAILALALLRALYVPAFRLAAVRQLAAPWVFALTVTLGLSNGYLLSCSMVRGPACVPPAVAHLAGNILVLFMVLGLCAGAAASFIWLLFPLPGAAGGAEWVGAFLVPPPTPA